MIENVKLLQDEINSCKAPSFGAFSERLFANELKKRNYSIESVHQDCCDFLVNGCRVDVKGRRKLESKSGESFDANVVSKNRRSPDTSYWYVVFYQNRITFFQEKEAQFSINWHDDYVYIEKMLNRKLPKNNYLSKGDSRRSTSERNQSCNILKNWILDNWNLKAKVNFRSGKATQEKMAKSNWGPVSFYINDKDLKKYDLSVMLFFDSGTDLDNVYEVYVYPTSSRDEIKFRSEKMNNGTRMTFDPRCLPERFKFKSVEMFKKHHLTKNTPPTGYNQ